MQEETKKDKEPTILDIAKDIIHGERNQNYGHPKDNFNDIANLWSSYLRIIARNRSFGGTLYLSLTETDVACMNILLKIARLVCNPEHKDSVVDIAGYAGTIERLWERD